MPRVLCERQRARQRHVFVVVGVLVALFAGSCRHLPEAAGGHAKTARLWKSTSHVVANSNKPASCFFDFFGKPAAPEEVARSSDAGIKTASYRQLKAVSLLRKGIDGAERWRSHCESVGRKVDEPVAQMPSEFVKEFLSDPNVHASDFLKGFFEHAKLAPVSVPSSVDDDDDDLGGFMDSNRFGLVKSDKWLKAEKELLIARIQEFITKGPAELSAWEEYCEKIEEYDNPDDEESKEVRNEMAVRSTTGRRKTALESWYDAQTGNGPQSGNKWGV